MALTFSLVGTWDDDKRIHMTGKAAVSGNYSSSGEGPRISVERLKVSLLLAFTLGLRAAPTIWAGPCL
jgi:hypothetical protein